MYGRNTNIFSNSSNSSGNNYGSSNNYGSNNSYGQRYGSQRLDYRYEEPQSYLTSIIFQWRDQPPASIVTRQQTLHLATTELRVEDYYLMRKQQMKASLEDKLRDAVRNDAFNPEILKFQFDHLPPVSQERKIDLDALKGGRYGSSGNSSSGNIFSGSSGNNSSSNIFSRNSSSGGNNIFSSGNSSGNNNYFSSDRGNSNNIFSSGNNNGSNDNIFNRGGSGNNIFSNNSNNNNNSNSNNIFNSNRNSGSSGNNIFNSNRGSNNIFSNNSGNSNNIFSNNNSGNNSGNNIFNNNRSGNNIFNNSSGGNNIFSNNSSNNNNNNNAAINWEVVQSIRMMVQENKQFVELVKKQLQLPGVKEEEIRQNKQSPFDDLLKRDAKFDYGQYFVEPKQQKEVMIVVPKELQKYQEIMSKSSISQSNLSRINQPNTSSKMSNVSRKVENPSGSRLFISNRLNNESKIMSNNAKLSEIKGTESKLLLNEHVNTYKSTIRMNQMFEENEGTCTCHVSFKIFWRDDPYNQMKKTEIKESTKMPNLKPNSKQWKRQLVLMLCKVNKMVRSDAQIQLHSVDERGSQFNSYDLVGTLSQKIINLPEQYRVAFSKISHDYLYNLTISNFYGSISWEKPIKCTEIDFYQIDDIEPFGIYENIIACELEQLNAKCRVTFFSLPQGISQMYRKNPAEAKNSLAKFVFQNSKGAFVLQQLWQEGQESGWTMQVSCFAPKEIGQKL